MAVYPWTGDTPNEFCGIGIDNDDSWSAPSYDNDGQCLKSSGDLFYNQIYVIPFFVNASRILSIQVESIEVWNAYLTETKTLSQLNGPTVEETGVSLISQTGDILPQDYNPLESRFYNLTVSPEGPPEVNALYTFVFNNESPILTVVGYRLIIWGFMPENRWIESFKWQTDVIKSYDGKEQFVKIRSNPRRSFIYNYRALNTLARGRLFSKIISNIAFDFGVPIWQQLSHFTSPVVSGNLTIQTDTTNKEYEAGGGVILWKSNTEFESSEIVSFDSSSITVRYPIAGNYSVKDYCMPMLICKMPQSVKSDLYPINATNYNFTFNAVRTTEITAGNLDEQYKGLDVLYKPTFMASSTQPWVHTGNWELIDFNTGIYNTDYAVTYAKTIRAYVMRFFGNLDEIWQFKQWLYKMAGRQGIFYIPDYDDTLVLNSDVSSTQTSIIFEYTELNIRWQNTPFIKDIQFVLSDGTIIRKGINEVKKVTNVIDYDEVIIDSATGISFTKDEVKDITLLHKVRIDTDTINFEWEYNGLCLVKFNTVDVIE